MAARYGGTSAQARFRRGKGTGGLAGYRVVRFPRPQTHGPGKVGGTVVARIPVASARPDIARGSKAPRARKLPTQPPAAPPPPAVDPMFAGWSPTDIAAYNQIGAQEKQHEGFITGQVMPWLSGSLNALSAYQQNANQGYLDYLRGAAGIGNIAGAIAPATVAPTTGGGIVSSPTSYTIGPAQQAARVQGSTAEAIGQNQAALAAAGLAGGGQGLVASLAAYVSGLPALYEQKRLDFRAKVDAFVADQAYKQAQLQLDTAKLQQSISTAGETARHNRVSEANAALRTGYYGLNATATAAKGTALHPPAGFIPLPNNAAAPRGYQTTVLADGTYGAIKIPTQTRPKKPAGNPNVVPAPVPGHQWVYTNGRWNSIATPKATGPKGAGPKPKAGTPGYQWAIVNGKWKQIKTTAGTTSGPKTSDVTGANSALKNIVQSTSGNNYAGLNDTLAGDPYNSEAIKQLLGWVDTWKPRLGGAQQAFKMLRSLSQPGYRALVHYYTKVRKPPIPIAQVR